MTLDEVDLTDPSLFQRERHHEVLTRLRREAPVYWHPHRTEQSEGFWCVTRHADVVRVNRDTETFISRKGVTLQDTPETFAGTGGALLPMLDPPEHTRQRRIVSRGFTPRAIARLEDQLTERMRRIVDAVVDRGECDFVSDIATELPLQAIAALVGVPPEDRHLIVRWGNQLIGLDDPEYDGDVAVQLGTFEEMASYAGELRRQRIEDPRDDLITQLTSVETDGTALSEAELGELFLLLTIAGHETTRNAAAHGIRALSEHPDQRDRLAADPSPEHVARAVEEVLRWSTPVMQFRRTATRDVELHGRTIRAGDRVVMWYASANRDEDVFDDPFRFDIDRDPNDHVTFGGGGPHHCIGGPLARLELRVLFTEVLSRMPGIHVTDEPELLRSNFVAGIKHLPVAWGRPGTGG